MTSSPRQAIDGFRKATCAQPFHCARVGHCIDREACFEGVVRDPPRRFVLRTIKAGKVLIYGKLYEPDPQHRAYDGRLDGQRWAFGLYTSQFPFVNLWGTERAYREGPEVDWTTRPDVIDGKFPWMFWGEVPR